MSFGLPEPEASSNCETHMIKAEQLLMSAAFVGMGDLIPYTVESVEAAAQGYF